jgi:hypothetical protein
MRARRLAMAGIGAAVVVLALPAVAGAAFHLIKVREVFAGGAANTSFVEVQMYSTGENFVQNHPLDIYTAGGAVTSITPDDDVDNGQNQRTVLFADTDADTEFSITPDFVSASLNLSPAGGAVCWQDGQPPDCVAWGNFTGTTLPAPGAGTPVSPGGIPAEMSITRSIARGCTTLLEASDDTNNSTADFAVTSPSPRPNSVAPTEMACPALPNTTIGTRPPNPSGSNDATFTYSATPAAGASFQCSLDAVVFATCPNAGITYMNLAEGQHTFQVRASNAAGTDATPASYTWTIDTTMVDPPETTITGGPRRTRDRTPTFRFTSDQPGVDFECKVDGKPYTACESPFTSKRLSFGKHTLRVRAIGDDGPDPTPAKRSFRVIRRR